MAPLFNWLGNLTFADPVFLYLLAFSAILFVIWTFFVVIGFFSKPEKTFGSKYPLIGKIKLWGIFVLLAEVFMVIALARPSVSGGTIKPAKGNVEAVVLLDVSFSMKASDIKPSRLEIAKREISNLEPLLREGDKIGLFVFGKASHIKLDLTKDFETFFDQVLRANFPENLFNDETAFFTSFITVLEHVYQSLDGQDAFNDGYAKGRPYNPKKRDNRIVVIFSDGEEQSLKFKPEALEEHMARTDYLKELPKVLAEYRKRGLKIYPVGIGTRKGASFLSLLKGYKKGTDYTEELEKEWAGQVTRLDKANLSALAKATGVDLSEHDWTVESAQGNARNYLEYAMDFNRSLLFELNVEGDNEPLWQYCLLVSIIFLALGIATYPFSGYLRKTR